MTKIDLFRIGLSKATAIQSGNYKGLFPARVAAQHTDMFKVFTEDGEIQAEVAGKLGFVAKNGADYPVVGDWVMVDRLDNNGGNAIIRHILDRHSLLQRKAAGTSNQVQPIASNIDTIFICMSLNNNYNLRRLERYLAVAWDSMATPVVVLTKSDQCDDLTGKLSEVHSVAAGVDVLITTNLQPDGHEPLQKYLGYSNTAAFIGSSGVGKSTLINKLAGEPVLAISETGENDKGRHTTTVRQMIILANGGVVIDTPGMRELQLETADLALAFADIEKLATHCRFSDCTHRQEPGCAVLAAVTGGSLSPERLASYHKLQHELKYQELNSRQLEQEKINRMFGGKNAMKQAMDEVRSKNRHR